jgi:hypothetical protein
VTIAWNAFDREGAPSHHCPEYDRGERLLGGQILNERQQRLGLSPENHAGLGGTGPSCERAMSPLGWSRQHHPEG